MVQVWAGRSWLNPGPGELQSREPRVAPALKQSGGAGVGDSCGRELGWQNWVWPSGHEAQ